MPGSYWCKFSKELKVQMMIGNANGEKDYIEEKVTDKVIADNCGREWNMYFWEIRETKQSFNA